MSKKTLWIGLAYIRRMQEVLGSVCCLLCLYLPARTRELGDVSRRKDPRSGGLTRMVRGLMLRMKKIFLVFNVFKIFVEIFVHNDS